MNYSVIFELILNPTEPNDRPFAIFRLGFTTETVTILATIRPKKTKLNQTKFKVLKPGKSLIERGGRYWQGLPPVLGIFPESDPKSSEPRGCVGWEQTPY